MPNPSTSLATLRPDLGASLMELDLAASRMGFIGYQILRPLTVSVQAGTFGRIPIEELLRERPLDRAPGSTYNRDEWRFTEDSFATKERGLVGVLDDREVRMYASYFSAEQVTTERTRDQVIRAAEKRVADLLTNTATFVDDAAGTAWTTLATADPLADVDTRIQAIRTATGLTPNAIMMPYKAWRALRRTTQFREFLHSSGAGESTLIGRVTRQQIADFFEIENVFIGDAQRNSAAQGQTAVLGEIWPATIVGVGRIATTDDIAEPCVGRTFDWRADGGMVEGTIESYRDEDVRGEKIRVRHDVQEKLLVTECWELITGVTA